MQTQRNVTLDVAKGLVLLTLPIIHSVLFYCTPAVHHSVGGQILAFIAEQAAPAFMLIMGIAITIGKPKRTSRLIKASAKLLLLGYFLNLLKFVVPTIWSGLPENLFIENGIRQDLSGIFGLFIIGDILQLAAISYLLCGFLYRLKYYPLVTITLTLFVIFLSPIVWNLQGPALLNGLPPETFFPVFPWISYPLSGILTGYALKKYRNKRSWLLLAALGILLSFIGLIGSKYEPIEWRSNFYRLGPSGTFFHIGSALLLLGLCKVITRLHLPIGIFKFLTTLSKHVTFVYMIQWILVCWCLPIFGYHERESARALLPVITIMISTILLTYLFSLIKRNYTKLNIQNKKFRIK